MVDWLEPPAAGADGGPGELGYGAGTWDRPQFLARGQLTTAERMPTAVLDPPARPLELPRGRPLDLGQVAVDDPLTGRPMAATELATRRLCLDGLLIWADGGVRHESYHNGMEPDDRHLLHSVTKTLTTLAVGIAVDEGRLSPDDEVAAHVPALRALPAWEGITPAARAGHGHRAPHRGALRRPRFHVLALRPLGRLPPPGSGR